MNKAVTAANEPHLTIGQLVGVLIEVPVMLSVVAIVNRTERWYEGRAAT